MTGLLRLAASAVELAYDQTETARAVRDRLIREAHTDGASYRDIGRTTGLHFTTVRDIVKQKEGTQ